MWWFDSPYLVKADVTCQLGLLHIRIHFKLATILFRAFPLMKESKRQIFVRVSIYIYIYILYIHIALVVSNGNFKTFTHKVSQSHFRQKKPICVPKGVRTRASFEGISALRVTRNLLVPSCSCSTRRMRTSHSQGCFTSSFAEWVRQDIRIGLLLRYCIFNCLFWIHQK